MPEKLRWSKSSLILLVGLLLLAAANTYDYSIPGVSQSWLLLGYLVLLPMVLPLRYATPCAALALGGAAALHHVNSVKTALMGFPLTYMDLRIFLGDPIGLFDALGLGVWSRVGLAVVAAVLCAAVTFGLLRLLCEACVIWRQGTMKRRLIPAFLAAGGVLTMFVVFSHQMNAINHERFLEEHPFWRGGSLKEFSAEVGTLAFLAYSRYVERVRSGDYFNLSLAADPPSAAEIEDSVNRFVRFDSNRSGQRPNIILVFVESTFDPAAVFELTDSLPRNALFDRNVYTQALGPLYVNPVGGGSWISEFESLAGVDARLFGFWGYYTHFSLSPLVRRTLVFHLRDAGYHTAAYYSAEGDFYNARNAFRNYGFEQFYDRNDLELPTRWGTRDDQMANAVLARIADDEGPFFKFISLASNHAPHRCRNFRRWEDLVTRFAAAEDFQRNCVLNEFIRETSFTAAAFERIIEYLKSVEKKTGRPFVALAYGDHQPHTFTATGGPRWHDGEIRDYSPLRRLDQRHTFFHLISSVPDVVRWPDDVVPHLTLVPSLLSAYAASSPSEVYLPVNFHALRYCGADFTTPHLGSAAESELTPGVAGEDMSADFLTRSSQANVTTTRCPIYPAIVAAIRDARVLGRASIP